MKTTAVTAPIDALADCSFPKRCCTRPVKIACAIGLLAANYLVPFSLLCAFPRRSLPGAIGVAWTATNVALTGTYFFMCSVSDERTNSVWIDCLRPNQEEDEGDRRVQEEVRRYAVISSAA